MLSDDLGNLYAAVIVEFRIPRELRLSLAADIAAAADKAWAIEHNGGPIAQDTGEREDGPF